MKEDLLIAHKVFLNLHHSNDQSRADYIKRKYGTLNTLIDRSLPEVRQSEDNDYILSVIRTKHLKDSTVTIVLIGSETYSRKWVDWEIYSFLRPYGSRKRNGILGIYLPSATIVPARLLDNFNSGYVTTMKWGNIPWQSESKINEAYNNRYREYLMENNRPRRRRNG
ncbi:TIR domain-containing protein [Bacillus sp. JJ1521]|uniref:TIR domain-containing protein n=1 Tax=Bacillus sp. JJ1521 TaxID=3122957 RepID=UPI002FFDA486